jgi:hypothetical protein
MTDHGVEAGAQPGRSSGSTSQPNQTASVAELVKLRRSRPLP